MINHNSLPIALASIGLQTPSGWKVPSTPFQISLLAPQCRVQLFIQVTIPEDAALLRPYRHESFPDGECFSVTNPQLWGPTSAPSDRPACRRARGDAEICPLDSTPDAESVFQIQPASSKINISAGIIRFKLLYNASQNPHRLRTDDYRIWRRQPP
jgi:hypothetical protein